MFDLLEYRQKLTAKLTKKDVELLKKISLLIEHLYLPISGDLVFSNGLIRRALMGTLMGFESYPENKYGELERNPEKLGFRHVLLLKAIEIMVEKDTLHLYLQEVLGLLQQREKEKALSA